MNRDPLFVVLSGPSGVGKDSILLRLRELGVPFHYTVTATTRPRRDGEVDGRDYYFYSAQTFEDLERAGGLLEHACVYGRRYGVPRQPVVEALARGQDVIVRTDIAGAASIRRCAPGATLIFIAPPSIESLEERLRRRSTESAADLAIRLARVREEMDALSHFDYLVVNQEGELDRCVESVAAILEAERCRLHRAPLGLL